MMTVNVKNTGKNGVHMLQKGSGLLVNLSISIIGLNTNKIMLVREDYS